MCTVLFECIAVLSVSFGRVRVDKSYQNVTKTCSFYYFIILYGPRQANLVLIAYASSEGSGEPAHPRSLARTSAARSYKQ